ncbi:hypothetical protein QA612_07455 [Evansella sp. AB-P1]|uniref:hypothetical protein n=1 Tax=Evansella sp. AB-P1 TaxID=3037653 RepID=UPI00241FD567|nr:hypothetical protein [Evansella sp. AB-P1]MDG5787327.1 hypothetical protein [Evansella sp. AB-P1]
MTKKALFYSAILLALFIFTTNGTSVDAKESEISLAEKTISNYFQDVGEERWSEIGKWFVEDRKKDIEVFLSNEENEIRRRGFFNIKKAELVKSKELPNDYGKQFIPGHLIEGYDNLKFLYVAVDFDVHEQNEYHIDGMNYFLVITVLEEKEWKIALTPHVPVNTVIDDGYGFGDEEEKTYTERRLSYR